MSHEKDKTHRRDAADRYKDFYDVVMSSDLSSAESLLAAIMDKVIEITDSEVGILLIFEKNEILVPVARVHAQDGNKGLKRARERIPRQIVERGAKEKKLIIADNVAADPDLEFTRSLKALNIRSLMLSPIWHKNRNIGMAYVDRRESRATYDKRAVDAFVNFSEDMGRLIHNSFEQERRRQRLEVLETSLDFPGIIGKSSGMLRVFKVIQKAAPAEVNILIQGDTGTGKELVAKAIHAHSPRAEMPFVAVNCAALKDSLLESELFGHVRGAFTGADRDRVGLFEAANGGTLFLDEIGEMSVEMQAKLLRAIEHGEYRRVGETEPRKARVRVISATNRNLKESIASGKFREDLFFRINEVEIHLPPLRERRDDIPILARYFLKLYATKHDSPVDGFTQAALNALTHYEWPGNVRELERKIKAAIIMNDVSMLDREHIPLHSDAETIDRALSGPSVKFSFSAESEVLSMDDLEREYIRAVLELVNFRKKDAARLLDMPRQTLHSRMLKLGIHD